MNYSFLTTMYKRDVRINSVSKSNGAVKVTYHELVLKQKLEILFFYQKYVYLGKHTSIHYIRINATHAHVNIFV